MNNADAGTLYIVGTPIGNLGDFSKRGIEILSKVDFIAAEDTRVTRKLLSYFDIHTPLISYYEHNRLESGQKILEKLKAGQSCALVSDAGMPAISDPGQDLVALCASDNIPVVVVPGPSAVISALSISGLATGRFCFEGFLSTAKHNRRKHLAELKAEARTIVFYEAPHKLVSTLKDMYSSWGDRSIVLAREMTKLYEEVLRTTLLKAIEYYTTKSPRGEYVIVIEGCPDLTDDTASNAIPLEAARALVQSGVSIRDAARQVSVETGCSRASIYKELLNDNH